MAEPAPLKLEDGSAIAAGFDPELDAERALRDDTRQVIADFQTRAGAALRRRLLKIRTTRNSAM